MPISRQLSRRGRNRGQNFSGTWRQLNRKLILLDKWNDNMKKKIFSGVTFQHFAGNIIFFWHRLDCGSFFSFRCWRKGLERSKFYKCQGRGRVPSIPLPEWTVSKLRTTKAAVLATSLVFLFLFLLFIYQKKNYTYYKLISSDNFRVILLSFDYSNSIT